eukprot:g9807.t1
MLANPSCPLCLSQPVRLFDAYQGEKELYITEGDHHSSRSLTCRQKATLFLCRSFHSPRLDALLRIHAGGAVDIFGVPIVPDWQKSGGSEDLDFEGSEICRQMRMVPALCEMKLAAGRRCQRPLLLTATMKLPEKAEAGFFLRFVPADVLAGETEEIGQPCCFVLSCTQELCMVSRVHSDTLRTLSVGPGLCDTTEVSLSLDSSGTLTFRSSSSENNPLLSMSVGTFRGELTLWQMLLRGSSRWSTFGDVKVEDSEATLCEHLGDAVLRLRHLGHADGVVVLNRDSISRPQGDHGLSDVRSVQKQSPSPDPELQRVTLLESIWKPEVLIGWRVRVDGFGEGIVTAVRRRRLRSTLFSISGTDPSKLLQQTEIPLHRQGSMLPWASRLRAKLLPLTDSISAWGGLAPPLRESSEFLVEQLVLTAGLGKKTSQRPPHATAAILASLLIQREVGEEFPSKAR